MPSRPKSRSSAPRLIDHALELGGPPNRHRPTDHHTRGAIRGNPAGLGAPADPSCTGMPFPGPGRPHRTDRLPMPPRPPFTPLNTRPGTTLPRDWSRAPLLYAAAAYTAMGLFGKEGKPWKIQTAANALSIARPTCQPPAPAERPRPRHPAVTPTRPAKAGNGQNPATASPLARNAWPTRPPRA